MLRGKAGAAENALFEKYVSVIGDSVQSQATGESEGLFEVRSRGAGMGRQEIRAVVGIRSLEGDPRRGAVARV